MMNNLPVAGVVAEYNPFHSGHEYHLRETKKRAGAVVAVMSGNFTQRCYPAVCEKHARAKMAVKGGADLVLALPARYALGSAEKFAMGAVGILSSLGFVDFLSFGSECGDIDFLRETAEKIDAITPELYREASSGGETFAKARQKILGDGVCEPNDILGVEYLRAINKICPQMDVFTVKRTDDYHVSATVLRDKIACGDLSSLPDYSAEILKAEIEAQNAPSDIKHIERLLLGFVRNADISTFSGIYGVNQAEGFAGRILSAASASTLDELYFMIKTKRYTMATVRRAVLSAYLRIKNTPPEPVPFVHVLAFSETGRRLIKLIPPELPVIHNMAKIKDIFPDYADEERRVTDLFALCLPRQGRGYSEFTGKL